MAAKNAKTPRMKKLPNDPKERGIVQHAFRALSNFFEKLESAERSFKRGYGVWEEEGAELVEAGQAALMFLDEEYRAALADVLRPLEQEANFVERGLVSEHAYKRACKDAALRILDATVGVPTEYEESQKKERAEEARREREYEERLAKEKAEREAKEKAEAEAAATPAPEAS